MRACASGSAIRVDMARRALSERSSTEGYRSTQLGSRTNISSSSPIASMWLAAVALYSSPLNASTSARPMLPQAVQRRVLHNVHAWHVAMRRGTHRPGEAICDAFILFDSEMGPLFGGTYACAESSEFGAFCHRHNYSTRVEWYARQLNCCAFLRCALLR